MLLWTLDYTFMCLRVRRFDHYFGNNDATLRGQAGSTYTRIRIQPTAACAAGVVTKTTDRDSLRYTYNGTRRVRQLALGCESN